MTDPSMGKDRRDISKELWATLETLSDDAQQTTLRKAKELTFDLDKGSIPFDETLINLTTNRDTLLDAIERARLPQLPLKIQETLLTDARKVASQLAAIANGNDAIIPLESAVEDLTASVWYSGLHNLTGSILGFQKKLNQLKTLESALGAAKRKTDEFFQEKARATAVIAQIEAHSEAALKTSSKIGETAAEVETVATRTKAIEQQASASLAAIAQSTKSANDGAATIGVHASETEASTKRAKELLTESEALREVYGALEEGLKTLKTSTEAALTSSQSSHEARLTSIEESTKTGIESLRKSTSDAAEALKTETSAKISAAVTALQTESGALLTTLRKAEEERSARASAQLASNTEAFLKSADTVKEAYRASFVELEVKANEIVSHNEGELGRLTKHLSELEGVIYEKIQLATNYQLFHSFQTRQLAIAKSKRGWAWALAGCVGVSLGASIFFICNLKYVQVYNAAFYLKLSVSLPIIFAITFCSIQFSRERRLEEEYAFKANISISLDPYRKLVAELIDTEHPEERTKYADFVIESINKVFASPTPHTFDERPSDDIVTGIIKEVGNIITPLAKIIRR